MPLARVVSFDGISSERMAQLAGEIEGGGPPEGMPPAEMMILHDPDAAHAMAIVIFDNEDDYRKGHEILDAMPRDDVPGQRTSVTKYDVAVRTTA